MSVSRSSVSRSSVSVSVSSVSVSSVSVSVSSVSMSVSSVSVSVSVGSVSVSSVSVSSVSVSSVSVRRGSVCVSRGSVSARGKTWGAKTASCRSERVHPRGTWRLAQTHRMGVMAVSCSNRCVQPACASLPPSPHPPLRRPMPQRPLSHLLRTLLHCTWPLRRRKRQRLV